jgi:hypothetical protein
VDTSARTVLAAAAAIAAGAGAARAGVPSPCPWDCALPHDKVVNVVDFLEVLFQWGGPGSCDLNGGGVSITDFLAVAQHWGPCPPPDGDGCEAPIELVQGVPEASFEIGFHMYAATPSGLPVGCDDSGLTEQGCPSAGSCCAAHGTPGCSDATCCDAICFFDAFCCKVAWDELCAEEAAVDCVACRKDLWYVLTNSSGGFVSVTVSTSISLMIEVSAGGACPPGPVLTCGQGSTVPFTMLAGASVTIRLIDNLQFKNDELAGTLTIESSNPTGCPGSGDCCQPHGGAGCADAGCCRRICKLDPFCCNTAWDSICASEAVQAPECNCCGCGSGTFAEAEACGEDTNGGCNAVPPVYTDAGCGVTACGSAWADGGTRDTDWYLVNVPDPDGDGLALLRARLHAQFAGICFIVDITDCGHPVVVAAGGSTECPSTGEAAACVAAPGGYAVFVAAAGFDGLPCGSGGNGYLVEIECEDCTCGAPGSGDCCASDGAPGCEDVSCCEAVCALDPYCCSVAWDLICAGEAAQTAVCNCSPGAVP